ncbi:MAG: hypothetical protein JNK79_11735 [Chitinophagaceae bacterium]|nr:hypothetical protein [Chitinophagaceae bacterium]
MNRRKEILDELKDAAPKLADIENQHPFRVPAGYFDSLPGLVLLRIKTENAFSAKEELEVISPLLSGLSKKMPFSTPAGYFDTLTPAITGATTENTKPARVVKMFQPRNTFRYAAAAITIGIIAIAAYFMLRQPDNGQYAMKPDAEVQKELQTKVDQLSENELANFLEASTIISYDNGSTGEINEDDVKLMLADIPDTDLEKFIDQNAVREKFN